MTRLPKTPVGSHPLVQCVRTLIDCIRERTPLRDESQNGIKIDYGRDGFRAWLPRSSLGSQPGAIVQRCLVVTVNDDTIDCYTTKSDGSAQASVIRIAKPIYLRTGQAAAIPVDPSAALGGYLTTVQYVGAGGQRRAWTVSGAGAGAAYVNEEVYPLYNPGDELFAIRGVLGGIDSTAHPITNADGSKVQWIDANRCGRNWRIVLQVFAVCIIDAGGKIVQKRSLFAASQPF